MVQGLLICPNETLGTQLLPLLDAIPDFELTGVLSEYPDPEEAVKIIVHRKIGMLFLCADDASAADLAQHLDEELPGFPIIAIGTRENAELLLRLMRSGVREHLIAPVEPAALAAAVKSERERGKKRHPSHFSELYSFLPARPGVGASTVAVNASCAMAAEVGPRTLLLDGDLWAGSIRFLLNLEDGGTLGEALERAGDLDEEIWRQLVSHSGKLDVLHAGDLETVAEPDPVALQAVLRLVCSHYDIVCADLASSLDPFTVELLEQSRKIFLVTTPEVVVLHMAAARVRRLRELGLEERVNLVLNRKNSGKIQEKEVAELVGIPVAYSLSNDYTAVQGAIMEASSIPQGSDLGQSILNLARSLAPGIEPRPQPAPARRKFLEFFHVPRPKEERIWRG